MISEEKLKKIIDDIEKYRIGEISKGNLDAQVIYFMNSNDRIDVELKSGC